jgi:uncharacterized protein YuzE
MKVQYFPETDQLRIVLRDCRYEPRGEDTNDPDVTLLYDDERRLSEIEVAHASERVNLEELNAANVFEEISRETEVHIEVPEEAPAQHEQREA